MSFVREILDNSFYNVVITAILAPLVYDFIKRKSQAPKLLMAGSGAVLRKDSLGNDVYVYGIEIYNSTKFFGYPISRRTVEIHGYDLYSSKNKYDYSVHPTFEKAAGEIHLPFELKSIMYDVVTVKFLAHYKGTNEYHIVERIDDNNLVAVGPEKIQSGSLKLKFVLRDAIWNSYNFNFTPIIFKDSLYYLRNKPLSLRYDYFINAILDLKDGRFKSFMHNFYEIFKITNAP